MNVTRCQRHGVMLKRKYNYGYLPEGEWLETLSLIFLLMTVL